MPINLDGNLSIEDVISIARKDTEVGLTDKVRSRVKQNRSTLEDLISVTDTPIYGVTTGFGDLVSEEIPKASRRQLQVNLVRSHSAGVGAPLGVQAVRAIMALRANSLARGYSGVRLSVIERLIELLNSNVTPYVPSIGSLGASGDLVPLAHVASVLLGEGQAYFKGELLASEEALERAGIEKLELKEKEGLALINGTQAMTALVAISLDKVKRLVKCADLVGAMTTYMVGGNFAQYDSRIYDLRPYRGHKRVAKNLRTLTDYHPSSYEPINVQDPYSIRCIPQVHGSIRESLQHVTKVVRTEINSVTDNPLIFEEPDAVISGGNFHGEPVALAADYLKIALSELGTISERRVNRLLHPDLNGDLPAFLAKDPGTNSGLMLTQYTSAALVSDNKSLSFPSSVDSIPVSGDQEDHVSMGMHSAENLEQVVENVTNILAIEMISACQAQEYKNFDLPGPLEDFYEFVRNEIPPIEMDRETASLIEKGSGLLKDETFLQEFSEKYDLE